MNKKSLRRINIEDNGTEGIIIELESIDSSVNGKILDVESTVAKALTIAGTTQKMKGETGENGKTGDRGDKGEKGEKGDTGEQGLQGEKGSKGNNGEDGKDGKDILDIEPIIFVERLNTLKEVLDISVIKGAVGKSDLESQHKKLLDGMALVDGRIKLIDQRYHGGGLSRVTTNSTLTGLGTPSSPLGVVSTGGVTSLTNADGTLTISPTTGAVVASLALGHANTWTSTQTFNNATYSALFNGGPVGIGTLTPSGGPLHIFQSATGALDTIILETAGVSQGDGSSIDFKNTTYGIVARIHGGRGVASASGQISFDTSGVERMVIDETGKVIITKGASFAGGVASVDTSGNLSVLDEVYSSSWNGSLQVPTKNAVYNKIIAISPTIPSKQILFGNGTSTASNSSNFTWDETLRLGSVKTLNSQAQDAWRYYNYAGNIASRITYLAEFSNNIGGSDSEQFGANVTASGTSTLAVGAHANASGPQCTAIGAYSYATGAFGATAIGYQATSTQLVATAIGFQSTASGIGDIAIGYGANAGSASGNGFAIGRQSSVTGTSSMAWGFFATVSDNNTMVLGGTIGGFGLNYAYFGAQYLASPLPFEFNSCGGLGTNIAGANLIINGGRGTGSGAGGDVIIKTAPAGATGSTNNAPVERMRVTQIGTTTFSAPIRLSNFTVATLPAGVKGDMCYCTDLLAPTFLGVVVGGGAIGAPVSFNGTNWVS